MSNIIAIEGPSGAGKTSIITELCLRRDYVHMSYPRGEARKERPEVGAWKSTVGDYQALSAATMFPGSEIITDRFFLSRFIYKAIEEKALWSEWHTEMLISYDTLRNAARLEAESRLGIGKAQDTRIFLLVLLPTWEQLKSNRSTSTRQYLYGNQELELYNVAASALLTNRRHFKGLTVMPYKGLANVDNVLELIDSWKSLT